MIFLNQLLDLNFQIKFLYIFLDLYMVYSADAVKLYFINVKSSIKVNIRIEINLFKKSFHN